MDKKSADEIVDDNRIYYKLLSDEQSIIIDTSGDSNETRQEEYERDVIEEDDLFRLKMETNFITFIIHSREYLQDHGMYEFSHQLGKVNMYDLYNHMCYSK
jgi:hypothetical protein